MKNLILRQQLFLAVRDIPYKIATKEKDASCVAKAKPIGDLLTRIGLECRVMKGKVVWRDTGIPKGLLKLIKRPFFSHFYAQVLIPETGKWAQVDATWDEPLKEKMPVNTWDGITHTQLAYPATNLQVVNDPFNFQYRDFDPADTFTRLLNNWYQSLRRVTYDRKNKICLLEDQVKPSNRDYYRIDDVRSGLNRLVAGLKEDGDEFKMFELMGSVLESEPALFMAVIAGSIIEARRCLGQDRRNGSSATLFCPIDAAIRVTAKREGIMESDPLSAANWTQSSLESTLKKHAQQIVLLAESNITAKNLSERAAHILWLIDQAPELQPRHPLSLIELGASGGLMLDALRQPRQFIAWMKDRGYRSDYGYKTIPQSLPGIGLDLVKPSCDWIEALVLEDGLRQEVQDFIQVFGRSEVIIADARQVNALSQLEEMVRNNPEATPFVYSCFMFYQLSDSLRNEVIQNTRAFLKRLGGGYILVSDIAKYMGYPDKFGGSVAWIENENGDIVSPKIFASISTLTEWEVL